MQPYDQVSPVPPLTKVTKVLIIMCVVGYMTEFILSNLGFHINGLSINEVLGLVPIRVREDHWYWQLVTYIFMHGHPLHILLNMLILWYFGSEIELKIGSKQFLFYFLLCGIGAGIFNLSVNYLMNDVSKMNNPIIGASGSIFGILAAYGIFFGNRYFLVFFLFPMKAKYFVLVMAAIELIMGVEAGSRDNVAHFAHVGGMFVGALYIYFRYVRPGRGGGSGRASKKDLERERLRRQFTLIVNQDETNKSDEKGPYWN